MLSPLECAPDHGFDALLEAARTGDKEAQGRLLETCRRPLLYFARRQLNPDLRAKGGGSDVVQDAFVKALREIDTFQGCTPDQLLAWLRVIVQHTVANFTRQFHTEKRQAALEVSREAATIREDPRHAVPSASDAVIRQEETEAIKRVLTQLPSLHVQVIRMRIEEDLSFKEIGRRTGRTSEAARQIWRRAVAEVRRELSGPRQGSDL
jgi:RNA polymerase sigma-70 factor (ECF subfamily)